MKFPNDIPFIILGGFLLFLSGMAVFEDTRSDILDEVITACSTNRLFIHKSKTYVCVFEEFKPTVTK